MGRLHKKAQSMTPKPERTLYLAGPISGLSYDEARHGWREQFSNMLPPHIHAYSPMRAKDFLLDAGKLRGDPEAYDKVHPISTASGIVTRDHNDVRTCDAMVANFLGVEKVSIGTCIEFGWAHAYKKPIIMVCEPDNIHNHVMLHEIAGYRTDSLEDAAHIATHLLTPSI